MERAELKKELDRWYRKINKPEFIPADPVQFPRRFLPAGVAPLGRIASPGRNSLIGCVAPLGRETQTDIEISAFLAATIAWGRRDLILRSAERMFSLLGQSPAAFVTGGAWRKLKGGASIQRRCVHRTFFEDDLKYFCKGFSRCYEKFGSLEGLFASVLNSRAVAEGDAPSTAGDIWDGIELFRREMAVANGGRFTKHIANPGADSACKRINLALRWLVRREGPVVLGIWKSVSPASLFIPLDVHVARTARRLGLLERTSNDRKAVEELTGRLREFCAEDPVRYDFALFGMGVGPPSK
jgi:uncharacterized protein (TIGR02757 family)